MSKLFYSFADRLMARLVPQLAADASRQGLCGSWAFCYCSRGIAYRKQYVCTGLGGRITACQPSGTC